MVERYFGVAMVKLDVERDHPEERRSFVRSCDYDALAARLAEIENALSVREDENYGLSKMLEEKSARLAEAERAIKCALEHIATFAPRDFNRGEEHAEAAWVELDNYAHNLRTADNAAPYQMKPSEAATFTEVLKRKADNAGESRCTRQKAGEYNMLRCCDELNHKGPCNFVVSD
jgi:hypothetical protein